MRNLSLAIHGGAGVISKNSLSVLQEKEYKDGLKTALQEGYTILENNGTALDAVQKAVTVLENFPLFNAGKGSVFTHEETNEMDASIMCGKTKQSGAVAAVKNIKNPIILARFVMEKSPHVLLIADGALQFAKEMNVEIMPDEYFFTEHRYQALQKAKQNNIIVRDHDINIKTRGTVGAVALDSFGNLAAATSTGGLTNKRFGRVGDSPIVGAGTYADNFYAAVSCTGHGEDFIQNVVAYDLIARMKYLKNDLKVAAENVLQNLPNDSGGFIAIDKQGNIIMPFNTEGMYRGCIANDLELKTWIYK
jgi:beta-aspartyl-peptidase (threonine type)